MLANEVSQVKQTFKKAFFLGSMLLLQNLILVKLKFPTIHSHNCDYGFSLVIYQFWKFYCCNKNYLDQPVSGHVPILYPLKKTENIFGFLVFSGGTKWGALARNKLTSGELWCFSNTFTFGIIH